MSKRQNKCTATIQNEMCYIRDLKYTQVLLNENHAFNQFSYKHSDTDFRYKAWNMKVNVCSS